MRSPGVEGRWEVVSYLSNGEIVNPSGAGPPAGFEIDGESINGTRGINRFVGQMVGGTIKQPLAVTKMAGPPELTSQESTLLEHLERAERFEVAGDGMKLSGHGLELMELRRLGADDAPSAP